METTRRPDGGGKLHAMAIGVHVGDGTQVDVRVGEDVAACGMAAFECAPDSALHYPVCLGVSEAMYSRQMSAASQNSANSRPVNSPPPSM